MPKKVDEEIKKPVYLNSSREELTEIYRDEVKAGLVHCQWTDDRGRTHKQVSRRAWCVHDGKTWQPRMEYALKWLGGKVVGEEIRKLGKGAYWEAVASSPEERARYENLLSVMVEAATLVRKEKET